MTAKLYHSMKMIPNKMKCLLFNIYSSCPQSASLFAPSSQSLNSSTSEYPTVSSLARCPVFPSNTIVLFFSFLLWFPQKSRSHSALPSCIAFYQSPSLSYFFPLNMPEKNLIQITDSFKSIKEKILEKNS